MKLRHFFAAFALAAVSAAASLAQSPPTLTITGASAGQRFDFIIRGQISTVFDPALLGTVALLIKADALSLSDGDPVATWIDSGGGGHTLTQGTSADRPTYKANSLNGHPVVRFDGANDFLSGTSCPLAAGDSTYTIVVVASPVAQATGALFSQGSIADTKRSAGLILFGAGGKIRSYWYGADLDSTPSYSAPATHIFATTYDGSARTIWLDGASAGSDAPSGLNIATDIFCVGDTAFVAGNQLHGDIAEMLIFSPSISPTNRAAVEAYLTTKYGL